MDATVRTGQSQESSVKDPYADLRKPADPYLCKEFWLECLKGRHNSTNGDSITNGRAVSKKAIDVAKKQNYALTRMVYGMPDGLERVRFKTNEQRDEYYRRQGATSTDSAS